MIFFFYFIKIRKYENILIMIWCISSLTIGWTKNHEKKLLILFKNITETVNIRMTKLHQYLFLEININIG